MAQGGVLEVEGAVSDRLVFNMRRLQSVLRLVLPQLKPLEVVFANVSNAESALAPGVATGFSAGVDSYAVLADYHYGTPPARFRLTHLLFNNVGAHWAGGESLFEKRYQRLRPVAERIGLPFVKVNSNLDAFYAGFTFESTHTFRNAAVALLLQRGIGTFLYASGYGYADTFVGEASTSNHSDAVTLPLMSTGAVSALSVGSEYSRVEKTLKLTSIPDTHDSLDVCFFEHAGSRINCSICEKCLRTMFTLELAGALDKYSKCFDKIAYMQHRENYLADLLGSASPLACELIHYASQISFEFPNTSLAKHRHRQRHKWHPVRIARGVSAKIRLLTR
jgi:hypothetical protein